jgi:peptidoglycan/LPS O-acetylase OafA/YrhL
MNLFYLLIDAGLFAVDIFFFLGGFLVSYTDIKKISDWKSCLKAILNRAFRLWPAYIYSILFFYAFYLHLGEGPFWGKDLFKV